jgi:hypothetical protein
MMERQKMINKQEKLRHKQGNLNWLIVEISNRLNHRVHLNRSLKRTIEGEVQKGLIERDKCLEEEKKKKDRLHQRVIEHK